MMRHVASCPLLVVVAGRRARRAGPGRVGADASRSSSWSRPAPAAAPTRWRASSRASPTSTSSRREPIIVVNKAGGAGAEGFLDVKGKKGDAHTIIITLSNLFTTPLHTGVPFSWKDLTPVARLAPRPVHPVGQRRDAVQDGQGLHRRREGARRASRAR